MENAITIPDWVPRDLFPFPSRFIDIDGNRIHYVDEGSGPVLLFLHGNPTWSFLYRGIIAQLKTRFRCIALDYPGFGLSTAKPGYNFLPENHARVVEAFVSALDLPAFMLMVQDWGGPIGLWMAGRCPDRITGLVIGNTWAWPITGDPHFERFSSIMGGAVGRFAIRNFNAFVNMMIPMGVKRRKLGKAVMAAYRRPFPTRAARMATAIFPREIRASSAFLSEVEQSLPGLSEKPALILWGEKDVAFREVERKRFEALFPCHRTVSLPGAGHYIQEDAPDEIATAIADFMDGNPKKF